MKAPVIYILYVIESKLDDLKEDVDSINQDVCHLNEKSKLPVGLYRIVLFNAGFVLAFRLDHRL